MKNTTTLVFLRRGLPIFHDSPGLEYFALAGAVLLLLAAGCGSGSDAPPGVTADGDDPDRVPTEKVILGTGWQLHEEEPDPLTDTVVHSLSNEVANLQKDAPTLRFYFQCVEGSEFRDFQVGDVEVRFSSMIIDLELSRAFRIGFGYSTSQTRAGVRWDQNEAEHQRFWIRTRGWRARGGLYTSVGPARADPAPARETGRFLDPSNSGVNEETINEAMRMFIGKMEDHRTLLLRFYHESYRHLDYRFDLRDFEDRMRVLRERCWGPADAD